MKRINLLIIFVIVGGAMLPMVSKIIWAIIVAQIIKVLVVLAIKLLVLLATKAFAIWKIFRVAKAIRFI